MPIGRLLTVPEPVPVFMIVKVYMFWVKVAVTNLLALMVRLAGLTLPFRSLLQPEKFQPGSGTAVSWTTCP